MTEVEILAVQRFYPQIYLACHTRHVRASSNEHAISANDTTILAHLDTQRPASAGDLAHHLAVAPSTLSEQLKRLEGLDYVSRTPGAEDQRVVEMRLTARGVRALQGASVLETERLAAVLARMDAADRAKAVDGLRLFAEACREFMAEGGGV